MGGGADSQLSRGLAVRECDRRNDCEKYSAAPMGDLVVYANELLASSAAAAVAAAAAAAANRLTRCV